MSIMKLAAYLKQVDLTYAQFAKKAGLNIKNPEVVLSRYARGKRLPRKARALQIIAACEGQVTLEELYGNG